MSTSFEKYNDILLAAYQTSGKANDLAAKKKEIFSDLFNQFDIDLGSILFVGFNPGILRVQNFDLAVTEVSSEVCDFLNKESVKYDLVTDIAGRKFDVIVAMDEYFTFASTDHQQRQRVTDLCAATGSLLVTTLRDYKNQDFRDREFSQPIALRQDSERTIYFEHYEYDNADRNNFVGTNYVVTDDSLEVIGPFERRTMFFKQLAKFSFDAGAKNFLVHQNLMHKSVIKKNYEHILTIKF